MLKILPAWNVTPLSILYWSRPVPPLALTVIEPLPEPKHVTSVNDIDAIAGAAELLTTALSEDVHPLASWTITL